jgi:hypothetical protein
MTASLAAHSQRAAIRTARAPDGMRWIQLEIVFLPTIPAAAKAFTRHQPAPK